MYNLKNLIIVTGIVILIIIIYEARYYIKWFIDTVIITNKNKTNIKKIQKKGMNIRNLKNEDIIKYINKSKEILDKINVKYDRKFFLNPELERHLRYSRFSEKYILELLDEILNYIGLDINSISLKINYISSKYQIPYAGLYSEKYNSQNKKDIVLNIQNDMTLDTIISILAHECTHHLLLSNNIRIKNTIQNECLTDVTAIVLGFGKYMAKGYKISNKIIYDEINHRSIKKDRVGYLSYKDINYALKKL